MSDIKPIIEQSFGQYAGAVLQSRALVDVRDCIKPSARQIFYSMLIHKLTADKPIKKTANAVGLAMADFYLHGNSSCTGVIMRAAQPFAMRYPIIYVEGNCGTLIESGNWAAERYTESKLNNLAGQLFKDIDKEAVTDWRDNYDDTKQYPGVLPSKGFYNIVNGTQGIGIGMASSIPQFNLTDVNNALIKLLWNPDASFEDIYCCPDFATGGLLLNENEVKESLKNGHGKSCKLRSVVSYDEKERVLIVTEIPYGVYTNTICGELDHILDTDPECGIERYNDLTGEMPLIKIYLTRKGNPDKVIKYLYKNTSLQSYFGINFTMLEDGRYPRTFTWKEALQAYLTHQINVYTNVYNFELKKLKDRLHIVEGIIIALAHIDEVVEVIRKSTSSTIAISELQKNFLLTETQAKAVLEIKLARLARLEVEKYEKEKIELIDKISHIEAILSDNNLLKKEIEADLIATRNKYGDARRTKVLNLSSDNEDEIIEEITLIAHITNKGNIYTSQSTTLLAQRRGGKGSKLNLGKDEYIIATINDTNLGSMLVISDKGKVYNINLSELVIDSCTNIYGMFSIDDNEHIIGAMAYNKTDSYKYLLFVTKNGMIKKTDTSEYKTKRTTGIQGIKLKTGDEIVDIAFINREEYLIATHEGLGIKIDTTELPATGRVTQGVYGIKLNKNDYVISGTKISNDTQYLATISEKGYIKKTNIAEYPVANRYTKGSALLKLDDNDYLSAILALSERDKEVLVLSTTNIIKFPVSEISLSSRATKGVRSMKIEEKDRIKNLVKSIE